MNDAFFFVKSMLFWLKIYSHDAKGPTSVSVFKVSYIIHWTQKHILYPVIIFIVLSITLIDKWWWQINVSKGPIHVPYLVEGDTNYWMS